MSDDETFESADAGAAGTAPIRIGELKKGSLVMIKGHPCKITDYSTAKTGKHGSAKAMYFGEDIFTGSKYQDTGPTSATTAMPVVIRKEYQLLDIDASDSTDAGDIASMMDPETGDTVDDLRVPSTDEYQTLRDALAEDKKDIFVTVVSAVGIAKIQSTFLSKDRK